jgi:serine-type D-Ala-D-Ala carboxypeptidase/endopeptidase
MRLTLLLCCVSMTNTHLHASTNPITADQAQTVLSQRFDGDRTGACAVAAVLHQGPRVMVRYCPTGPGPSTTDRFEMGSVGKTMLAALVAKLIKDGAWTLDDPISKFLPEVRAAGPVAAITVRQLLTHTSGLPALPSGFIPANLEDPYAGVTPQWLLKALAGEKLAAAPGAVRTYSNYGAMVLSVAVERAMGGDLQQAFARTLFEPLGMASTRLATPASPAPLPGHAANGQPAPRWTGPASIAGVGLVTSTLEDMVRYAQGHFREATDLVGGILTMTREPAAESSGMAWLLRPIEGRQWAVHEGGTGGFSSFVAIDAAARRAVVVMASASLTDVGGLSDVGLALLQLAPPPSARKPTRAPVALLSSMPGDYNVAGTLVTVTARDGSLYAALGGSMPFELLHDSRGDLYLKEAAANITPTLVGGKAQGFMWRQGGGVVVAERSAVAVGPSSASAAAAPPPASPERLEGLLGVYQLIPGFDLRVFRDGGQMRVQASGQEAVPVSVGSENRLMAPALDLTLDFERDAQGKAVRLVLRQRGQTLSGPRRD